MILTVCRALAPAVAMLAALASAQAQQQPAAPPQQNPYCARLEAQLQAFDRGGSDASNADQVRKYEEAANNQQAEIDRQEALARRAGCSDNGFFVLFSGQPAQCGPLNNKIQQMRSNLDTIQGNLERLRGGSAPERGSQRRAILVALSQNNCGAQYQAAVAAAAPQQRGGGLFDTLFGPGSVFSGNAPGWSGAPSGTYRTLCVRTCDGFYYPISYATTPARFAEDEKTCRQSCPAAEVMLFSHRNPGEDVSQAVSVSGQLYSALPNAFRYRQAVDPNCVCKPPGESWAQALKNIDDNTVEQGDIVVNEQRARTLSQPRVDAQGRPIKVDTRAVARPADPKAVPNASPAAAPHAEAPTKEAPDKPDPNRTVRAVGPTFIPAR